MIYEYILPFSYIEKETGKNIHFELIKIINSSPIRLEKGDIVLFCKGELHVPPIEEVKYYPEENTVAVYLAASKNSPIPIVDKNFIKKLKKDMLQKGWKELK